MDKPLKAKIRISKDALWKGIIGDFFEEFFQYFFPKDFDKIDWTKGYEFLDNELEKIIPIGKDKRRRADRLVKVFLKTGQIAFILIHVEVQGYVDDKFDERMYIYQYRIFDKFKCPVIPLAIYTDNSPSFHPKVYQLKMMGMKLSYTFNTYKLLEQPLAAIRAINNPFALVMETAWHGLQRHQLKSDEDRLSLKLNLYRRLLRHGYTKERIRSFVSFIEYYTVFDKSDFFIKFEEEIHKTQEDMGIQEFILLDVKEQGIEQGIEIAEKKAQEKAQKKAQKHIINLYKMGLSIAFIVKALEYPKRTVEKVIDTYKKSLKNKEKP